MAGSLPQLLKDTSSLMTELWDVNSLEQRLVQRPRPYTQEQQRVAQLVEVNRGALGVQFDDVIELAASIMLGEPPASHGSMGSPRACHPSFWSPPTLLCMLCRLGRTARPPSDRQPAAGRPAAGRHIFCTAAG